jgi:ADP-heptose:LPS heptosyltransferase
MNVLIVKLNATGDVVRTTTLLHRLQGHVTWITAEMNTALVEGIVPPIRCLSWMNREAARDRAYDLVINLEDEQEVAAFLVNVDARRLFGAHLDQETAVTYTDDSRGWFDLSLISKYGRKRADELKLANRRTYQDLVFDALGMRFADETYRIASPAPTDLSGDVAIAPVAGPVWPMKGWGYYDELKRRLEGDGLTVNVLPRRPSLLEHLGDVANHRCLVSGDSLPMHFALGTRVPCVTLFNCTSPWEIHDYGLQVKIVSPLLERFFYQRGFVEEATTAITLDEVYEATLRQLARRPAVRGLSSAV